MTLNDIKESISVNYIRTIAQSGGMNVSNDAKDYGEDLTLKEVIQRNDGGNISYMNGNRSLALQLKATTEDNIQVQRETITYKLRAKNYNDLIARRSGISPLILILFVLPTGNVADWVQVNEENLLVRKNAFWFLPGVAAEKTTNTTSKTISIPTLQRIESTTFSELLDIIYG